MYYKKWLELQLNQIITVYLKNINKDRDISFSNLDHEKWFLFKINFS